jgi:SNF2 family DNA or RNA helicase
MLDIENDYQWTGRLKPFDHQKTTSAFLVNNPKSFCFNEQGTGKTASAIWAADYLMKKGEVKRVLVLCPLSIMKAAWQQDLFKFAMHRSCSVAHGTAKAREKIIAAGCEFVVMNFDGLGVVKDAVMKGGFDLIIVDEANAYKNAQTQRWKHLREVAKTVDRLWMMTGTPAAQSPVDAYGLAKLVDSPECPRYFTQFRAEVMYKATLFKWLPKPGADAYVHKVLQPAIRFERDQCLDLPEVLYVSREAPLTPQQLHYYRELRSQMLFEADGEQVTAVHAAAKLNKLLQISGGAVYTDTGDVLHFDVSNRMNVIKEAIEEASHKVLVFVPFTHTIDMLRASLEDAGISCGVINGDVSLNRRSVLVEQFQNGRDPRVLLIQPQAASHGLTLTAANTVIWYAPVTSVETYLQANARINRPGQKNAMNVIHVCGSDVERRLYKMLEGNIETHLRLVELYRQELELAA